MKKNFLIIAIIIGAVIAIAMASVVMHRESVPTTPVAITPATDTVVDPSKPADVTDTTDTSSTTIDTSDWQTYRNEEYGFEVKYPKNENGWISGFREDDPQTSYTEDTVFGVVYDYQATGDTPGTNGVAIQPKPGFGDFDFSEDDAVRVGGVVDVGGKKALIVSEKEVTFFKDIISGEGRLCQDYTYIGIHVLGLSEKWSAKGANISINCSDRKHAPLIRAVFGSIRFF